MVFLKSMARTKQSPKIRVKKTGLELWQKNFLPRGADRKEEHRPGGITICISFKF